jgi:hypothetical protein
MARWLTSYIQHRANSENDRSMMSAAGIAWMLEQHPELKRVLYRSGSLETKVAWIDKDGLTPGVYVKVRADATITYTGNVHDGYTVCVRTWEALFSNNVPKSTLH